MEATEFKYDVFISYSHKDEEWVRNILLPTLENYGVKVCIDYRDFVGGSPSIKEMERAVKQSRKTVPILTPNYLASGWSDFELSIAQTLDPGNQNLRVIPLLKRQCELPLRIAYLSYINFTKEEDETIAWRQLLIGLGKHAAIEQPIQIPSAAQWFLPHPYAMPQYFTGRVAELQMLDKWLIDADRLLIMRGLGGFGKSALAWQWLSTHVNPVEWTRVVWWSFYEGDESFDHFIEETLKYLKLEVPQAQRSQVDELLKAMQSRKILLIMDGFERALRSYSNMNAAYQGDQEPTPEDNERACVNINAEFFLRSVCVRPGIKSKVLMTTRLTPHAIESQGQFLQGCTQKELIEMDKADTVAFFRAHGIRGLDSEIEAACATYGYHPLSLSLLAGRILKDFESAGDIVIAQKFKIDGDIKQHQHHVLEVSYGSLPPDEQKLLSAIACFRSASELKTVEVVAENKNSLNDHLHDLVERGLLYFDVNNKKFDLHPIVRHYAYSRLGEDEKRRNHYRLMEYFKKQRGTQRSVSLVLQPEHAKKLQVIPDEQNVFYVQPLIERFHHSVRAGYLDDAQQLYRTVISQTLFDQFGAYSLTIELLRSLFLDGEDKPPRLKNENAQAKVIEELASSFARNGQPRLSEKFYELYIHFAESIGDNSKLTAGLGGLSDRQIELGLFREAEKNLIKQIDLAHRLKDGGIEAFVHLKYNHLLIFLGEWQKDLEELVKAWERFLQEEKAEFASECASMFALRSLQIARGHELTNSFDLANKLREAAIDNAGAALTIANGDSERLYLKTGYPPMKREIVRGAWLLGTAFCSIGNLERADYYLSNCLLLDRNINLIEIQAWILVDSARLRYKQGRYEDAVQLAIEALSIAERCGYVLQGADVNLFLAQYALEQEKDAAKAKEYAETALKLAYCDGPPYYYKVAYQEAARILERLK